MVTSANFEPGKIRLPTHWPNLENGAQGQRQEEGADRQGEGGPDGGADGVGRQRPVLAAVKLYSTRFSW